MGSVLRIRWFPPLDRLFGGTSETTLEGPIPVGGVLERLTSQVPAFASYARFGSGDTQAHGLLVWRRGELLTLSEVVQPGDELEILMMVTGG